MSTLSSPSPVVFFFSILFNEDSISLDEVESLISQNFQENYSSYECQFFPMKEYYSKEMGAENKLRRYFFFLNQKLVRDTLIDYKILSEKIEVASSLENRRVINIDPGYITLDQVVLATGKPYSHRIYLGQGVYAELTYSYQDSSYKTLHWTYPDYSDDETIKLFNFIRGFNLCVD